MKLTLREVKAAYMFEKFMDYDRHEKLQKALFLAVLRSMIYHGHDSDILIDIVEQCQTTEEAVFMAMQLEVRREFITDILAKDIDFGRRVLLLGLTRVDEHIVEKEAFLLEMDQGYNEALEDFNKGL